MKEKIIAENKNHLKDLIKEEITNNGLLCDLNHIDTSKITDMSFLFEQSKFNGDISQWDTSNVKDMNCIFSYAKFNGDISNWNVENVESMNRFVEWADFDQDISKWKPYKLTDVGYAFEYCYCSYPFWSYYEDKENRKQAIDNYHLYEKLDNKLPEKNLLTKQKKI